MILSAQSIRKRCNPCVGSPMIEPFVERGVHEIGMSFGLSSCGYDLRLLETTTILPGQYMLGSSLERFSIPNDLVMHIRDKSSWARQGIFVQNTQAEPGWRGWLTLEISNNSLQPVIIATGTPICQVVFEMLDEPTELAYSGKYQDQGPQAYEWIKEKVGTHG